jgi:hypothetical protein
MYIFQVVSAFVPAVGTSSSPSGGKIATAMLLSWLVSVILLSNAIGDLGPPLSNEEIFTAFMLAHGSTGVTSRTTSRTFEIDWETSSPGEASRVWSSAIYYYRPSKGIRNSGWYMAVISVLPVGIAFGTAFAILQARTNIFQLSFTSRHWGLFILGSQCSFDRCSLPRRHTSPFRNREVPLVYHPDQRLHDRWFNLGLGCRL